MTTLAGRPVGGQNTFSFNTGGPAIRASHPSGETTIDEDQAFALALDAAPSEESLLAHVSFAVAALPERLGIRLITGEVREAILSTIYGWSRRPHVIVLQARQRFPSGAQVRLMWGKGVTSESGVATEQDQVLACKVREVFTAQLHCEREHRQAACLPIRPLTLRFSNAVAWELARQAVLIGPDTQHWRPEIDRDDGTTQYVTSITFKGPFPESAALRLELPEGLTDDAGRSLANVANFPLQVETAEFPPLAKFAARFGIIEWKAGPVLPVMLRNLEPEVQGKRLQLGAKGATPEGAAAPEGGVAGKHWRVSPEQVTEVLR